MVKVVKVIRKIFRNSSPTAEVAKNRLQLVLSRDRRDLTSVDLEGLKRELLEVISKYFDIQEETLQVEILDQEGHSALQVNTAVASLPTRATT